MRVCIHVCMRYVRIYVCVCMYACMCMRACMRELASVSVKHLSPLPSLLVPAALCLAVPARQGLSRMLDGGGVQMCAWRIFYACTYTSVYVRMYMHAWRSYMYACIHTCQYMIHVGVCMYACICACLHVQVGSREYLAISCCFD
jgi:hypothetical protein